MSETPTEPATLSVDTPRLFEGRPRLGVLFVHGIGPARRGETLPWAGEALYKWLASWLKPRGEEHSTPRVYLANTRLSRAIPSEGDAPAYGELFFTGGLRDSRGLEPRWVLAESWWAAEFPQATFSGLISWGLGVAPWLIRRNAESLIGRIFHSVDDMGTTIDVSIKARFGDSLAGRVLRVVLLGIGVVVLGVQALFLALLGLVLVFVLGFLAQLLILALLLLSFLPPVRGLILSIQQVLAASLGDAYLIASSPVRLNAMLSQVRRDIDWLHNVKHCEHVAVVAHSGGADVAYEALTQPQSPHVELFITYGNGLAKLEAIRDLLSDKPQSFSVGPVFRALAVAVIAVGFLYPVGPADAGVFSAVCFSLGAVFWLLGIWLSRIRAHDFGPSRPDRSQWLDFYAVADPVPDGPLPPPPGLEPSFSTQVENLNSVLQDHGEYWYNNEQFVASVARALCELSGQSGIIGSGDAPILQQASAKRRQRVFVYMASGIFSTLAVPVLWFGLGPWLYVAGETIRSALGSVFLALLGIQNEASPVWSTLFGMAAVAAGATLFQKLVLFPFWRDWSRSETDAMYARDFSIVDKSTALKFLLAMLVLPVAAFVLAFFGLAAPGGVPQVAGAALGFFLGPDTLASVPATTTILAWTVQAVAAFLLLTALFMAVVGWVFLSVRPAVLETANEKIRDKQTRRRTKRLSGA